MPYSYSTKSAWTIPHMIMLNQIGRILITLASTSIKMNLLKLPPKLSKNTTKTLHAYPTEPNKKHLNLDTAYILSSTIQTKHTPKENNLNIKIINIKPTAALIYSSKIKKKTKEFTLVKDRAVPSSTKLQKIGIRTSFAQQKFRQNHGVLTTFSALMIVAKHLHNPSRTLQQNRRTH